MDEKLLKSLEENGLIDVVKEFIKTEQYVSVATLQRNFSIGYVSAKTIFDYLIECNLIEKNATNNKGNKVIATSCGQKIYLLDISRKMTEAWKKKFKDHPEITIVCDDFKHFMDTHNIECVVSPANSYGFMDGGYDLAITNYFGDALQKSVQRYIRYHLYGEQPIATSILFDIPNTKMKLIHTPTMQKGEPIVDKRVVYQCMRTTLICALSNKIGSIVIPAFGGLCGHISPQDVADQMFKGYIQILSGVNQNL